MRREREGLGGILCCYLLRVQGALLDGHIRRERQLCESLRLSRKEYLPAYLR